MRRFPDYFHQDHSKKTFTFDNLTNNNLHFRATILEFLQNDYLNVLKILLVKVKIYLFVEDDMYGLKSLFVFDPDKLIVDDCLLERFLYHISLTIILFWFIGKLLTTTIKLWWFSTLNPNHSLKLIITPWIPIRQWIIDEILVWTSTTLIFKMKLEICYFGRRRISTSMIFCSLEQKICRVS